MFLHTMLTKADHTLNVRNHRLGLVKAQEDGVTSADLGAALASVAHDLNNPLTYALANLDYLKEEPDENSLELMQDAYDGLERMSEIVRNLGQQQGDMTEFSVEDVIDIAVRSTREEIGARATLVVDIQNPDAMILGRRSGIVQVLVNLLTNATHAVPEGQPDQQRIAIHSVTTENRVEIVVSDTGHGIPESIHNRVMEPFFTTKGIGEGTGLGLAICKRIATEHRGDLRIGTEPGETTNVTLSLPRRQRHNSRINTSTTLTVQDSELARLRVLVIDDDPGMRKLVQRALKPMKVEVLDDGRRAASLCLDHEFDVVVCDVMMPNISGEEVYRAVVAAGKEYSDRFLFMTGGVFTDGESAFLDEMEGRVLLKPMKMDALRELILERHHRGSAGPVRGST
jgi:CheY-like chemotaxis protein/anti-sigma regulatory factor (Ser/Thr protein kinase)